MNPFILAASALSTAGMIDMAMVTRDIVGRVNRAFNTNRPIDTQQGTVGVDAVNSLRMRSQQMAGKPFHVKQQGMTQWLANNYYQADKAV